MKCKKLYWIFENLNRAQARIQSLGVDDRGHFLVLDQTIFHPQGGGQPSDMGTISGLQVLKVLDREGDIRHYVEGDGPQVGDEVELVVDQEMRSEASAYHSAGHLVAHLVSAVPLKGHHFPGEAYIEFAGDMPQDKEGIVRKLQRDLDHELKNGGPIHISIDENGKRWTEIKGQKRVPCGGTHIGDLSKLQSVTVGKVRAKNGNWRISYQVQRTKTEIDGQ